MAKRPFNGSPTVDGYYTTFDSSEVHRVDEGGSDDQGGGGSSDFSTATVTIVDNVERNILLPFIVDDDGHELHSILNLGISGSGSYTVPLYKGSLTGIINEGSGTVSVSGDITFLPNEIVVVTGDGTITIS